MRFILTKVSAWEVLNLTKIIVGGPLIIIISEKLTKAKMLAISAFDLFIRFGDRESELPILRFG